MKQARLAQLRQLVRDATPEPQQSAEARAAKAFQSYEFNAAPTFEVVQTPRARAIREVTRICSWYGWGHEVARALDAAAVETMHSLADDDLDQLVDRMRLLEDCVQHGGDAPDAPPAR